MLIFVRGILGIQCFGGGKLKHEEYVCFLKLAIGDASFFYVFYFLMLFLLLSLLFLVFCLNFTLLFLFDLFINLLRIVIIFSKIGLDPRVVLCCLRRRNGHGKGYAVGVSFCLFLNKN